MDPVVFLEQMLRIPSPPGREAEIAGFLKDKMNREFGLKNVKLDEVGNVLGEAGSGGLTVLLCGHMDTVPGQQPVRVNNKLICGRGAVDAKSALAAMIAAASMLKDDGECKVIVAALRDEEGSGLGIKHLVNSGLKVDYAVFGEPSGIENITVGYKGSLTFNLTLETSPVHSSAPWMSQNAVEKAVEAWDAIKKYTEERSGTSRYKSLTACLTRIRGGSFYNVTPAKCTITVNMRIPPGKNCMDVWAEVERLLTELQKDPSFPRLSAKIIDMTEPFEAEKDSPLVRAFVRAILKVKGKRPLLLYKTGTGDMNVLGHSFKIPVVTYGPGDPHLSHTRRECVEKEEYLDSVRVYVEALKEIPKLHTQATLPSKPFQL